ncbi:MULTISPECIES: glutamine--fructose-6-phosphate transaminase (isomerizing) [unclassified Bradyrhizobium]|uniref:glutamine--fructose-6-phosphate transaminase (isomerizing) n=1 Tax=unclassified Bradyrhizobium TaxID=2631580 RepID=UPI001CD38C4A|nr:MULTISPECIES: glutamine--fructose-6-phosphate transaminase (isomerizing) [unclassified Bradyrhizobium]MCA1386093.1 glutamine--fructose-6-phosphate transaminase (isomerizing) [Bradyrhizobium sp. BRP05]MCA1393891.1 glutamine--fructose-6-phosphate transaminase (isomerizing) [Bradyrhizobium sp. IC3123]MCA1423535.1 glutamine--fructose-6-phosphate transaminase (isomerizing) [Bradyrhizobium sp. BRP23]MCA1431093.1 glutamine--fructose-6-phosphate transaminase (isomerizing) [Bradyrhizobium sp. NBAIM16
MCGIVGIVGRRPVSEQLIVSLKQLEYCGYDSAGVATLEGGHFYRQRAEGKLKALENRLRAAPVWGHTGIGHTRWTSHRKASAKNAHLHATDNVSVVHNGVIENYPELRAELERKGAQFASETDTEVVAHIVESHLIKGYSPQDAVKASLPKLGGPFALVFLFKGYDDLLIGACNGSPLAIGHGDGEMYLASDEIALAPFTERITHLEDGDWAVLTRNSFTIYDMQGVIAHREVLKCRASPALIRKANYRPFMLKEIHRQPKVAGHTLARYVDASADRVAFPQTLPFDFNDIGRILITGCGTARHAGHIGKYWFERLARIPVEVDVASELRYREPPLRERDLAILISQSGETADTLAALRFAKSQGLRTLSVVNVPSSTIARESETVLQTLAGPEMGVPSTKAFSCQLIVLAALAIANGRARGELSRATEATLVQELLEVPRLMTAALATEPQIEKLAREVAKSRGVLCLGRGSSFPLALEGALKLKEIAYIHADGYAAGELKHGPLALISDGVPVVVIAPSDSLFQKTVSNMQEVAARGGNIILITDPKGAEAASVNSLATIVLPDMGASFTPIVYDIPMQLLAYHTGLLMGTDVDQPRNLARSKSVIVE